MNSYKLNNFKNIILFHDRHVLLVLPWLMATNRTQICSISSQDFNREWQSIEHKYM